MEKYLKRLLKNGVFAGVSPKRSRTMSAIRGKNNRSTELKIRMTLVRKGIRGWKCNARNLPGHPDFYFCKKRLAVFIDGCFWHGCPKCGHIPKTRSLFWKAKIQKNKKRDRLNSQILNKMGLNVLRIWEHEIKTLDAIPRILHKRYIAL